MLVKDSLGRDVELNPGDTILDSDFKQRKVLSIIQTQSANYTRCSVRVIKTNHTWRTSTIKKWIKV